MRVASFNANSLRSRLPIILSWLESEKPDALCVQETKVTDADFPADAFREAGYWVVYAGQKSYNGVAIISAEEPSDVVIGLGRPEYDAEARIVRAKIGGVSVVNTYVPQGTAVGSPRFAYKLDWLSGLGERYFRRDFSPDDLIVWVGDLNVAREAIDVYDPEGLRGHVCFHPDEQLALESVMNWGFVDVFRKFHPAEAGHYTFWDYRVPSAFKRKIGWRLDHIMATKPLAEKGVNCWIDAAPRLLERPSDHTFIAADFDL